MTRAESKTATREKVLATARSLFMDEGYERATIRDIAKAAGVSTGAIFSSYEDKAALIRAAFGERPAAAMRIADAAASALLPGGWPSLSKAEQDEAIIGAGMLAALVSPEF